MLSACVGSTSAPASDTGGAAARVLEGKRTAWGPVSLILPTGFTLIETSDTRGTGDDCQQTHLRHLFADVGERLVLIVGQAPAGGFPGSARTSRTS